MASTGREVLCADVVTCAAYSGNSHCLKWLWTQHCPWSAEACTAAASSGHLGVLKWLREQGCPWTEMTIVGAIQQDQHECMKWAIAQGCPLPNKRAAKGRVLQRLEEWLLQEEPK